MSGRGWQEVVFRTFHWLGGRPNNFNIGGETCPFLRINSITSPRRYPVNNAQAWVGALACFDCNVLSISRARLVMSLVASNAVN